MKWAKHELKRKQSRGKDWKPYSFHFSLSYIVQLAGIFGKSEQWTDIQLVQVFLMFHLDFRILKHKDTEPVDF